MTTNPAPSATEAVGPAPTRVPPAAGDPFGPTPARVQLSAALPVDPERAFAVVSDPTAWPAFFAPIHTAEAGEGWGRPGGRARVRVRVLGRLVDSELEVLDWAAPHLLRYVTRQRGRPDLEHVRVLVPVTGGTRLLGTVRAADRTGPAGLADRVAFRALQRVYDRAMHRLPLLVAALAVERGH